MHGEAPGTFFALSAWRQVMENWRGKTINHLPLHWALGHERAVVLLPPDVLLWHLQQA